MFKIENWGSDTSNIKNSLGGPSYFRYYNQENNDITTAGYFPDNLRLKEGDRIVVIPQDTDAVDELYVVTAVNNGTPTVSKATGGGDEHNKGYFADLTALQTAYPTGADGDYAILGSTDTVWVWDSGTNAWVDTDTKGEVTSVNGQTGAVSLSIPDAVQYSTMPTAGADNLGDIVQFTGTTDANYTNGYFYKCVSDGQEPATYSWTQTNVQPAPSGLPDQTGQSGKFLTTDGTDASWSDKPLVNKATGSESLSVANGGTSQTQSVNIGVNSTLGGSQCVALGYLARTNSSRSMAIGYSSFAFGNSTIAIGYYAQAVAQGSIQISTYNGLTQNTDANTFKVANHNGNFEIMDANGNLPADRLASTTGLADGNYRLRLTMASGVATLTWVAE